MFCRNCGTQLPDTAVFCSNCGTRVAGGNAPVSRIKFSNPDVLNSDPGRTAEANAAREAEAARQAQMQAKAEARAAREAEAARQAQMRAEAEARAAREAEAARQVQMQAEAEARAAREAEAARQAQMRAEAEARAAREAEAARQAQMQAEADAARQAQMQAEADAIAAREAEAARDVQANAEAAMNAVYSEDSTSAYEPSAGENLYDNNFKEYQEMNAPYSGDMAEDAVKSVPEYPQDYQSVEPQPEYDRAEDYKIMDWSSTQPGNSYEVYTHEMPSKSGLNIFKTLNSAIIMIVVILMTFVWFRISPTNAEDARSVFGSEDGSISIGLSQLGAMTGMEDYFIENIPSSEGVKTAFTAIAFAKYAFIAVLVLLALCIVLMFAKHKIASVFGMIANVGVIGLSIGCMVGISIANDTLKSLEAPIKVSASPILYVVLALSVISVIGLIVLVRTKRSIK